MINEKDFIVKVKKNGNNYKQFKATCNQCLSDRGYVDKSNANKLCRSCTRKQIHTAWSPEKKKEVGTKATRHFIGSEPWNKGKTGVYSEELIKQWQDKHTEISADEDYRKRMSCSKRSIKIDDFKEFSTTEQERERAQLNNRGLHTKCFERDNYTCQTCATRGTELNAHHKNAFDLFPEERFKLDNLTTLCKSCHDSFHSLFGRGKNTEEQFELFKTSQATCSATFDNRKTLYLLTGAPASGKSWVLSNLTNFNCLDSDVIPKKDILVKVKEANKPILSLTIGVSTFIKNNPDLDIKLIVICEDIKTLNKRMQARDGRVTPTIERRAKRMEALAQQAIFSGNSREVLGFLKSVI